MLLLLFAILEGLVILVLAFKLLRPKYDGVIRVTDTGAKKTYELEIEKDPENFDQRRKIVFRVAVVAEE